MKRVTIAQGLTVGCHFCAQKGQNGSDSDPLDNRAPFHLNANRTTGMNTYDTGGMDRIAFYKPRPQNFPLGAYTTHASGL